MPPDMMGEKKIDMRHNTKLKAEEAAILSGELSKPSWESKNEGIHERVSFEDTIWGFDLAGGSYYHTPLRVVGVKPGSRAEKAGIRIGDRLKRINDIETSTLTIQEAHEIIVESGVHLKIAVTAPEDEEDAYYCYQDPLDDDGYDSEEERRREAELARKRQVHAKVRSDWSLQWPWVSKRRIIWHESNCYMVPSKYEANHKDKFSEKREDLRKEDDIVLQNAKAEKVKSYFGPDANKTDVSGNPKPVLNKNTQNANGNDKNNNMANGDLKTNGQHAMNGLGEISEAEEDIQALSQSDISFSEELSQNNEIVNSEKTNDEVLTTDDENVLRDNEKAPEDSEIESSITEDIIEKDEVNEQKVYKTEDDSTIESILSDSEEQILSNAESVDER